jgi:Asp-tRNA(Asn)/Glu-tRNA(Gln) amidotransferase A subunit family amidase
MDAKQLGGRFMHYPKAIEHLLVIVLLASNVNTAAAQTHDTSKSLPGFHLLESKIDDVHTALRSGQITCRGLVGLYLKRIQAYDKSGPALNSVQTVNPNALQEAERLDAAFKSTGFVGSLHCVPVLVKDQVETSDMPTTYGSAVFKDFIPRRDATIVTKLKNAGAIIVGKTTMGEYAYAYVGSAFGIARNAYDLGRSPSGSSSGTGSGISANFATVGIGEDTGGSIRGPAAVSSLVGLRPTVPLVSRHGMLPARPTTDTLGPITRTVKDAAMLLGVIAGYDPNDPVTAYAVGQVPSSYTSFLSRDGLKGARIGVIREPMDSKADPASEDYSKVKTVIDKAIGDLGLLGAEVVDPVTITDLKDRIKKIYENNTFETEQAINKYLEQHANAPAKTLREILLSGKVVPSRANKLMGNLGRSTDELGYLQVLLVREETRQTVLTLMADKKLDALVYATFDHQPSAIAPDVLTNPNALDGYILGNRPLAAGLGFPAMTVPAGFTSDNLPVGLEFMGRPFAEGTLLKLGFAYEQGTLKRKPPTSTPTLPGEP